MLTSKFKIAVDVMTAESGLSAAIRAVVDTLRKYEDIGIYIVGDQLMIEEVLESSHRAYWRELKLEIVPCEQVIDQEDDPVWALKNKKKSSTHAAVALVASGDADAIVSCANTGALLAVGRYLLKRRKGVEKLAMVGSFPTYQAKEAYICDVGASYGATAEDLHRQAIMASALLRQSDSETTPVVGLLNIGTEDSKGTELIKEVSSILKNDPTINYHGTIEGHDIFKGHVDIVICDGFVGNCVLKSCEGTANFMMHTIKRVCTSNPLTKLVGGALNALLRVQAPRLNPSLRNGALVLGLNGIMIKSHGHADALGIATAIAAARKACVSASDKITEGSRARETEAV